MPSENTVTILEGAKSSIPAGLLRHLFLLIGVAFSVAVGITIFMSIQEPSYRPLDYQVNHKNMSSIIDTLDKAKIKYKINESDGVVLVAAGDVEQAKIRLSVAGVSKDDEFGYSFLNEQGALGNSQFLENARYIRALENDLAKTISAIEGVSGANVHIAIPRNNVFADENNKVTASVVLNISPQFMSNKEKVHSIMKIMADSVPGLDPKDVSITDQYGHSLSDGFDSNSIYSAAQLNYQNSVQSYYEKRIESMIVPLLGENKVIVRVNAVIDYTQNENSTEEYDPNKTALLSEQTDNESNDSSGASGPPGSLSNSPPDDPTKSQSSATSGGGQKRTQSTKNYNVTKSISYKKSNVAIIKSLSVAVIVDNQNVLDPKTKAIISQPISKDELAKLTKLVQTVIGFDPARGDIVTVINSTYSQVKQDIPSMQTKFWEMPWFWDVIKKIIGILLGFIFLFFVYRKISKAMSMPPTAPIKKSAFVADANDNGEGSLMRMHEIKEDGMNKLKQYASEDPTKVASIIKNWVGK